MKLKLEQEITHKALVAMVNEDTRLDEHADLIIMLYDALVEHRPINAKIDSNASKQIDRVRAYIQGNW